MNLVYNTLFVAQDESNPLTQYTQTNLHLTKHKDTADTVETVQANSANFANVNSQEAAAPTKEFHSNTSHIIKKSTKISGLRRNNIWANRNFWQKDGATISNANRQLINYTDGEYLFSSKLIFLVLIILKLRNQQKVGNRVQENQENKRAPGKKIQQYGKLHEKVNFSEASK